MNGKTATESFAEFLLRRALQWCCLLVCVASIWAGSGVASAWMLMAGVAASRLGLWMFDLAAMQLMQDGVPEHERCVVGGVQNSLQSVFDLLTYIMGIIISDPRVSAGHCHELDTICT